MSEEAPLALDPLALKAELEQALVSLAKVSRAAAVKSSTSPVPAAPTSPCRACLELRTRMEAERSRAVALERSLSSAESRRESEAMGMEELQRIAARLQEEVLQLDKDKIR